MWRKSFQRSRQKARKRVDGERKRKDEKPGRTVLQNINEEGKEDIKEKNNKNVGEQDKKRKNLEMLENW